MRGGGVYDSGMGGFEVGVWGEGGGEVGGGGLHGREGRKDKGGRGGG